jgi:2-polyprenyl-3-methyl-5-hydroxy-6-metoxy-1,4-benzoquinol methylase
VIPDDQALLYPAGYYTHESQPDAPPHAGVIGRGARDWLRQQIVAAVRSRSDRAPSKLGSVLAASRWIRERAFRDLAVDEMIPRGSLPGRALDIGCGAGGLLVRLSLLGWSVEGLEWDERAAEVARRTGFAVHLGTAANAGGAVGSYELVVLNHVLEHLPDPAAALRGLAALLAPSGKLVLVYPNPGSLGARRFGSWWFGWEAPRHLVLPTFAGLRLLGERLGLRLLSARTMSRSAEAHSSYSRAYRAGRPVRAGHPELDGFDRAFKLFEALAVGLRLPVGEASVVSLSRDETAVSR